MLLESILIADKCNICDQNKYFVTNSDYIFTGVK